MKSAEKKVMIQVRHVPDKVHRKLKARAAEAGLTLSDYVRRQLERISEFPTNAEIAARIAARPRPKVSPQTIVDIIREERDRR